MTFATDYLFYVSLHDRKLGTLSATLPQTYVFRQMFIKSGGGLIRQFVFVLKLLKINTINTSVGLFFNVDAPDVSRPILNH